MSSMPAVLQRYAARYQPVEWAASRRLKGFSGAEILHVIAPAGEFCLRGWPPQTVSNRLRRPAGAMPRERILGLHRLLAETHRRGVVQVAVPVKSDDGTTLVSLQGGLWQLEPWMPGSADFLRDPSEKRLRSVLCCLARWHSAAATFQPAPQEAAWFLSRDSAPSPAVSERLQQIQDWTGNQLARVEQQMRTSEQQDEFHALALRIVRGFRQAAPQVARELQTAADLRFRLQPCWRDLWHDHLLFTGDELTGMIDASACRTENIASDLARLLGSLFGDDRSGWDRALGIYQEFQPLTVEELGLVTLLDRSLVLLSGLTWLDRRYLQQQTFADLARVVARLKGICARLEHLVATL
jgi:Ser/Thr protein kinase RdoA (MazF antagonist)